MPPIYATCATCPKWKWKGCQKCQLAIGNWQRAIGVLVALAGHVRRELVAAALIHFYNLAKSITKISTTTTTTFCRCWKIVARKCNMKISLYVCGTQFVAFSWRTATKLLQNANKIRSSAKIPFEEAKKNKKIKKKVGEKSALKIFHTSAAQQRQRTHLSGKRQQDMTRLPHGRCHQRHHPLAPSVLTYFQRATSCHSAFSKLWWCGLWQPKMPNIPAHEYVYALPKSSNIKQTPAPTALP